LQRRHLSNVELITQDGKKVRFYDGLVKDKRVVIQFMFTRCKDICPVITHHLVEVQQMLDGRVGRDIFLLLYQPQSRGRLPSRSEGFCKEARNRSGLDVFNAWWFGGGRKTLPLAVLTELAALSKWRSTVAVTTSVQGRAAAAFVICRRFAENLGNEVLRILCLS
jgi:hypothetical protein